MVSAVSIFLLVWFTVAECQVYRRQCNRDYELQCENGECIHKNQWCDGEYDCADGTDEYYCDGSPCLDIHFRCNSGRCIPSTAWCDNYKDCPDGSDEVCESDSTSAESEVKYVPAEWRGLSKTGINGSIQQAVLKASDYLLNEVNLINNKGASIFRAVVGLSFAETIRPLNESQKELLKKQLNIETALDLMQNTTKLSLPKLALCVNAIFALCENPRNFRGMDLVKMLRSRTDTELKSSSVEFPFVFLTLCVADEYKREDLRAVDAIYKSAGSRIGVKSLALMAIICGDRRSGRSDSINYVLDFSRLQGLEYGHHDVYTKGLFLQACNAAGIAKNPAELLKHQLPDGSFSDVLSTYQVIPALLGVSILDVRCGETNTEHALNDDPIYTTLNDGKNVTYSIIVTSGTEVNSHSMIITVDERKTFYDVMKAAANKDPMFKFLCDDTAVGKKLYSLAGIPNDPESGLFWTLYRGQSFIETSGLNNIVPKANDIFVFKMQLGQ